MQYVRTPYIFIYMNTNQTNVFSNHPIAAKLFAQGNVGAAVWHFTLNRTGSCLQANEAAARHGYTPPNAAPGYGR